MKNIDEIKHFTVAELGEDGGWGYTNFPRQKRSLKVVFSFGEGWDHVSVSHSKSRPPSWEEMCMVKDMFFHKDETVIQYHPAEKDYINNHPYCLHMWKPQNETLPTPPTWMIGVK